MKANSWSDIIKIIESKRNKIGMTVKELDRLACDANNNTARYLSGQNVPNINIVMSMLKVLDIQIDAK